MMEQTRCRVCNGTGFMPEVAGRVGWRRREEVLQRCQAIRSLYGAGLQLKEVALEMKKRFGSLNEKPMHHSTVVYHASKKCKCDFQRIGEDGASATRSLDE